MTKDSSISTVRLISVIMIISCHILQGLGNEAAYWVNLGVQIFFFMSGYLYGKKEIVDYKTFYKTRLIKILLPTSIIVAIMLIVEKVFFNISYSNFQIISNLLGFGTFSKILETLSHTWFISYILICYLITPILQTLFKKNKNSLLTLLIIIIFLIFFRHLRVILINHTWIINYVLGYFFTKCCVTKKQKNCFSIIILSLAILILPLTLAVRYNLVDNIPANIMSFKKQIWDWEHVLLGTSLFIIFYNIASKINIKYNFILKFSDKYNFFIYLTHQIFILGKLSVLNLTNYLIINILIIYVLSILGGVLLYYIYQGLYNIIKYCFKKINSIRTTSISN